MDDFEHSFLRQAERSSRAQLAFADPRFFDTDKPLRCDEGAQDGQGQDGHDECDAALAAWNQGSHGHRSHRGLLRRATVVTTLSV